MKLTVRYHAQARQAAPSPVEEIEVPTGAGLRDLPSLLASRHGGELREMLLTADGRPHPSILWFIGDEQVDPGADRPLRDGDEVTLLSPIAGG